MDKIIKDVKKGKETYCVRNKDGSFWWEGDVVPKI
jgi:hypothetical protein